MNGFIVAIVPVTATRSTLGCWVSWACATTGVLRTASPAAIRPMPIRLMRITRTSPSPCLARSNHPVRQCVNNCRQWPPTRNVPSVRILISADMEGATGVTWPADVEPGTEQWQRFRRMFNGDVNACVRGLVDGGADDVLVNEAHDSQRNLLLEELDERARMLTGKHKPLSMMQGIESGVDGAGVDGVVFLGYHTGAGAEGVLSHTYLGNSVTGVWLDGVRASEGRLNAAVAAEHGVPVLLVTGDDKTCADAGDYVPTARQAAVKECVSRYSAICLPPKRTVELIR